MKSSNRIVYLILILLLACSSPNVFITLGDDSCLGYTYGNDKKCNIEIKRESDKITIDTVEIESISRAQKGYRLNSFQHKDLICFEIPHHLDNEYIVYDLNQKKIINTITVQDYLEKYFTEYAQKYNLISDYEQDLNFIYLESCSPSGKYVILDHGTGQNRTKFLISNDSFQVFKDIIIKFKWITDDSFEYWETPLDSEVSIPVKYVEGEKREHHRLLQEKRIWANGYITRTNDTMYIDEEH
ncbi:hypothetical protein [Leptospira bandrabouensis]|uniref:hypothetical protein n=1 Tax=Leptospira bandrabouensis TaxID=2484903 RepID=UPI001EE8DCBE|nr:hypothetical protein [Leptospira bandrabouensis]MCG6146538.1 hypothetical protein [Leptospira bandrabouensis]MCG6161911.1 hypothetical protein [Leptospira bandrabouensis]MCG6166124.1 hypothetical protein [Leptospira bandrabouensis]